MVEHHESDNPNPNPEREERILNAAAELIAHYGYDKTTVSEIAKKAGVSKGAIYLHYASKEDLLAALLLREQRRMAHELLRRLEADPQGGTLYGFYRHSLLVLADNPFMSAIYLRDPRVLGAQIRLQNEEYRRARYEQSNQFAADLQQAGLIREDISPAMASFLLTTMSTGLLTVDDVLPAGERPSLEELAEGMAGFIQHALGPAHGSGDVAKGRQLFRQMISDSLDES